MDQYDEEFDYDTISKKSVKSKPNLRQKNTKLLAESNSVYAAKKVSRKDLEDDSEDSQEISDENEEFSDDDEIDEINIFKNKLTASSKSKKAPTDEQSDEEDSDDLHPEGQKTDTETEEEGDEECEGESEEEDEQEDEEEGDEEGEECDEEGEEDDEGLEEEEDDEGKRVKLPKSSLEKDISKGKSIQNQLSLWDNLLECRIKIHKGIHTTNQLPQESSNFKQFSMIGGKQFESVVQETQSAVKSLLDSCLELQVFNFLLPLLNLANIILNCFRTCF